MVYIQTIPICLLFLTLGQAKYLCDHDTCIFSCHVATLAGDMKIYIFFMVVKWLLSFLASSKCLRASNQLSYARTTCSSYHHFPLIPTILQCRSHSYEWVPKLVNNRNVFDFLPIFPALCFRLSSPWNFYRWIGTSLLQYMSSACYIRRLWEYFVSEKPLTANILVQRLWWTCV